MTWKFICQCWWTVLELLFNDDQPEIKILMMVSNLLPQSVKKKYSTTKMEKTWDMLQIWDKPLVQITPRPVCVWQTLCCLGCPLLRFVFRTWYLPSGKHSHHHGKSPFWWENSNNFSGPFQWQTVKLPEGYHKPTSYTIHKSSFVGKYPSTMVRVCMISHMLPSGNLA